MIGLALLAWRLANLRVWGKLPHPGGPHVHRPVDATLPAHEEYYAICDRIARGERP